MHKKKKRALITGGAGFIGTHLCEELLSRGFKVTVIDNLSTAPKSNLAFLAKLKDLKVYKDSILNEKLLERLIKNSDIVYHLAAAVGVKFILDHPLGSMLTNVEGTQIILRLANKYHKKILLTSTSEVYGKHVCSPIQEDDDRTLGSTNVSRWSYSDAKAIDEFLALAYSKERKLSVIIVRLFNTVGPRQVGRYGMVLPRFIKSALAGEPITVYGDGLQTRCFAYVKDVVRAIVDLSLEKKAEGQVFNIGNDQPISIKDLALKIKEATQSQSEIKYISYEEAYGDKSQDFEDIECRVPNISKVKNLLNYQPQYNIDKIIEATVEHFRSIKKGKK
jgi:UDP-glucose 4-epimerase